MLYMRVLAVIDACRSIWPGNEPSLEEAKIHAKAMRSIKEVLEFTARNRSRLQVRTHVIASTSAGPLRVL